MDNPDNVTQRITDLLETLSPKHKQVARFVLDNWYFTSFSSASQVSKKIGTSAASVVRFSQAIGYEGYSKLQEALRAEMPNDMTTAARMQKRMSSQHPPDTTLSQVFYTDIRNIERTASGLSIDHMNAALDHIQKARRVLIIGAGASTAPVIFLTHSLKVMGFEASSVNGEGLQTAVDLAGIKPEDLLIAIDLWRYVRSTVNAVSQAKTAGASVIAITDSIVSPLSKLADIALEISTEGVAHSLSITAIMSLLNVMVAMLADRASQQVYASIRRVDEAYRNSDLLIMKSNNAY